MNNRTKDNLINIGSFLLYLTIIYVLYKISGFEMTVVGLLSLILWKISCIYKEVRK